MPPIVRHMFRYVVLAIVLLVVFHRHVDIIGPIVAVVLAGLAGVYRLAPGVIDSETGRVRHDKAPVPELIRARRRRRQAEREDVSPG